MLAGPVTDFLLTSSLSGEEQSSWSHGDWPRKGVIRAASSARWAFLHSQQADLDCNLQIEDLLYFPKYMIGIKQLVFSAARETRDVAIIHGSSVVVSVRHQ
jgi:hypothetical protein